MAFFDLPLPELESYLPELDEPADFDEFWARTLAETREHDLALALELVETGLPLVEHFDVTFAGFGGHPVKAWLSRPAGPVEGPLPAVVQFLGYGGGRGLALEHLTWANAGYAHLLVDTRGQGSRWGSGGHTPDPAGSGPSLPGFMTRGLTDPHEHYYRRVYTDGVRAVDAMRALEWVDSESITVTGASQGGGITLAVAGLVPGLRAAMPDVPFLSHFRRAIGLTDAMPYGEVREYLAVHRDRVEQAYRTLSYLDGVSFARRAQSPALFSVALMDTICPPSTVYAAFNHWGAEAGAGAVAEGEKEIAVYSHNGHEGGGTHQLARQIAWLAHQLR
ncbi:acetylxylan esterase [Bogoriella caseilytica]|uniref:Cephalosporin-C deacetylase n=1 Tax=Bogoriella caseilytica TaxID=56055 RepID=A0A3N2BDR1_9MICO|nr:acetylxylan esterase [Bogoriella caseilytica]ROR73389.1 cephalosporin-C deacetylase [Bogoriella caseilytica]